MLNEADTRVKLIDPKLHESGWQEEFILRDRPTTPGRTLDEEGNRRAGKKPDYILLYSPSFAIAVVEAKDEMHSALDGMQQAKGYAHDLDVLYAFSNHLTRLRPDSSKIVSQWLSLCLRHLRHVGYFQRNCTRWVNQAAFNRKKLINLKIPLPPIDVQRHIVAKIEEVMSRIELARKLQEETLKDIEATTYAVLERAFSGKL